MFIDFDEMTGVLDLSDQLVVEVEDGLVVGCLKGEIPQFSSGDPYRHGFYCLDQKGGLVLVTTDMDFQTLVI